ncbi:hypothetical protein ACWF5S_28955 [Peribacillus butanolivorans]
MGQFPISLPFTYPVRLFLEAKFKKSATGIDVVRTGIGILQDLNSNYQTIDLQGQDLLSQRYNYQYVIFSTSGFSNNAIKLAIAHKIQLIDLSGIEYDKLRRVISETAKSLNTFNYSLKDIRQFIRDHLFNLNYINRRFDREFDRDNLEKILYCYIEFIRTFGDLYLASTNSPFTISLKPSSSYHFKHFLDETKNTTFDVKIRWTDNNKYYWHIYSQDSREITFSFALPTLFYEYIFKQQTRDQQIINALDAKKQYFNNIVFYVRDREQFVNLKYRMPRSERRLTR